MEENCLSTVALFPMKKGENAIRSAALSQKAALQMPFFSTPPPVKMRLERSAERDKREIINILSAEHGQSASGGHSKSSRPLVFIISLLTTNRTLP